MTDRDGETPSLRELAEDRDFLVGAASGGGNLTSDTDHAETLRREFNLVNTQHALKWGPLTERWGDGEPGTYDFGNADAIASFARRYDVAVRGHALVFQRADPEWLRPWERTPARLRELLRTHIHTVVGRYRDDVFAWDVVNEAIDDDGGWRDTHWYDALGPEYVDLAFEWADEVAPGAKLFYNDYGIAGDTAKTDAVYEFVADLLDRGVPIDGVGFQLHALGARGRPDPEDVGRSARRFRELGLDVHVTEMDVAFDADDPPADPLEAQADYYRGVVEACLDAGVEALVVWGVSDRYSWVRNRDHLTDDPLLFDEEYRPKPAYEAVREALRD